MKLIIISKLNCIGTNRSSVENFVQIVNRIKGCEYHSIKYGKLMLFTKFMGHEFNYHTVNVSLKKVEKYSLEISIESIVQDFVKVFDLLSANTSEINWNVSENISVDAFELDLENLERNKIKKNIDKMGQRKTVDYEAITFILLEAFINAVLFLMNLSNRDKSSLMNCNVEIKDISLARRILTIEVMFEDELVIIDLNPKAKEKVSIVLDNDNYTGRTIKSLIVQNNFK